jgi:RNA recognition motif-containing protein
LFFEYATENNLVIKSKKVKVGWGNPSTLPTSLSTSVKEGATRNVYIGGLDLDTTEEELEKVFGLFGEIEMINFKPQKGYGFVSFTDISCAIRAVATLQTEGKYLNCKIGYGKDRCGLPLRSNGAMTPPTSPVIFDYLQ